MRRASLVLLIAACAWVLVACGGDDDPTPAETTTATPIPTASPLPGTPEPTIVSGSETGGGTGPGGSTLHVVAAGDTLSGLAARFNTTVEAIQQANDLTGVNIFIGQELTIPEGSTGTPPTGSEATPEPTPAATEEPAATSTPDGVPGVDVYIVQAGDTLSGIAEQFDTTVEAIQEANGMTDTNIFEGQELQLPRP